MATATIHQAPPALVTEGTAHRVAGLGRDAADGAKTLRQLCRRGLPSVDSREGRVVVLADLLAWIREHGSVMPAEPPKAKPDDDDRELLRSAGVRLRAVGGR